jgi:uncharacterized protein
MARVALCLLFWLMPVAFAQAGISQASDAYKKGDYARVLRECRDAAAGGEPSCANMLGVLYAEGKGVAADQAEAVRWFRISADAGNGYGAFNLGLHYEHGNGVAKDLATAEKWFRVAARQGIPDAELGLAQFLIKYRDDWHGALAFLKPASAQGLAEAQFVLAFAYETAKGTRRNARSAVKWYEAAADHGYGPAQTRLADLYEHGKMVETDYKEAYFWYAVAARDNNSGKKKTDEDGMKRCAAHLSKSELADAQETVKNFQPGTVALRPPRRSRREAAASSDGKPRIFAIGSGFYVSRQGHLLTNNHVVAECSEVHVTEGDGSTPAKVLATDKERDLALVQVPHGVVAAAVFHGGAVARPGETVVAVGFPLAGLLSSDPIVTAGIINALSGLRDNRNELQISAPLQPGNSGGPIFDSSGHIVGIAVAKLAALAVARATGGIIPENVNFAIKADVAADFLRSHGVTVASAPAEKELSTAAIAAQADKMTVRVECWK